MERSWAGDGFQWGSEQTGVLGGQLRTMAVYHPVEVSVCVCFNVYSFLRDRERQTTSGGGSQREGDIEPEAGSRL